MIQKGYKRKAKIMNGINDSLQEWISTRAEDQTSYKKEGIWHILLDISDNVFCTYSDLNSFFLKAYYQLAIRIMASFDSSPDFLYGSSDHA